MAFRAKFGSLSEIWLLKRNLAEKNKSLFSEVYEQAVFSALRKSASNYLFGHNRKKSRANGLNTAAYWLFWPNITLSMEILRSEIEKSTISGLEKAKLINEFNRIRFEWPPMIEQTLKSVANGLQDLKEQQPTTSDSQPLTVAGIRLSSDLPSGDVQGLDQEILRYRSLTLQEFTTCK